MYSQILQSSKPEDNKDDGVKRELFPLSDMQQSQEVSDILASSMLVGDDTDVKLDSLQSELEDIDLTSAKAHNFMCKRPVTN